MATHKDQLAFADELQLRRDYALSPDEKDGIDAVYKSLAVPSQQIIQPHIGSINPDAIQSTEAYVPRNSMQAWRETLYVTLADGTAVTSSSESIMFPIYTLPANYLYPGRTLQWTVMGRQSTAITTPGTITHRLVYSATGLGAVAVVTSGAFAPDPTAAATNLTFTLRWWAICRSSGTSGTMMGWGDIAWSDYDDASAATIVGNLNMGVAPTSAPANATIDTTVARSLNPSYQSSVATASMTCHAAILEALT